MALIRARPYKLDKGAGPGAGMPSNRNAPDIFRSSIILKRAPLMQYCNPEGRWNYPGSKSHSTIPYMIIGLPFDNTKPRKGRWGEMRGTKYSDLTDELEEEFDRMKVPRLVRERQDLLAARADLELRIEQAQCEPHSKLYRKKNRTTLRRRALQQNEPAANNVTQGCSTRSGGRHFILTDDPRNTCKSPQPARTPAEIPNNQSVMAACPCRKPNQRNPRRNQKSSSGTGSLSWPAPAPLPYYRPQKIKQQKQPKVPLLLSQPEQDGNVLNLDLRPLPKIGCNQPWWKQNCRLHNHHQHQRPQHYAYRKQLPARTKARYYGLHFDPTLPVPNETILKYF